MVAVKIPEHDFHPLANIFPLMAEPELSGLTESISSRGFDEREPVILLDGQILDGRNRYRASKRANVLPVFEEYAGPDPLGLVIAKNAHRRHMSASQRAMSAARLVSTTGPGRPKVIAEISAITQERAAALLHVDRATVQFAAKVLSGCVPEIVEAVEGSAVSVSDAASVADLPFGEQRRALEYVRTGRAKTLAAASKLERTAPKENYPAHLSAVLGDGLLFRDAERLSREAANAWRKLEDSPAYRDAVSDLPADERHGFSEAFRVAETYAANLCPKMCADCRGEGCDGCNGKGWRPAGDVSAQPAD